MFLKWFKKDKLKANKLIDWLKTISTKVDCSEKSIYFNIEGLSIRYSDHITTASAGLLHIIKLENSYLVYISVFKLPKTFETFESVKTFIESFIFIYKICHRHIIPPLEEIAYAKKQDAVRNKLEKMLSKKDLTKLEHYHKSLRQSIKEFILNNPDKLASTISFIGTNLNAPKVTKEALWQYFTSR